MLILILGLVLFLGIHSVSIAAPAWRDTMDARHPKAWKAGYSIVSAIGLVLLIWGYGLARQNPVLLYTPPVWMRHLTLLLMLPVFPLLFAAYMPGRIKTVAKHPMLLSIKLWALAHLLANGMLADLLLFGGFLAWAVADRISLKRRVARPVPGAPPSPMNDAIAVVAGLVTYALTLVWGHRVMTGVSPLG